MSIFVLLGYACWGGSFLLLLWLFMDFLKTNAAYDEDFLLSSREGHDEITEQEKMHAVERDEKTA